MNRRDFSTLLASAAGTGLALTGAGSAFAQGAPVEGKDYVRLQTPSAVTGLAAGKKVEVIEFFWYGCPHCFSFEPTIEAWSKRLAPDIQFRQMPFAFIGPVEHQKLFYALEEIGQREALQKRIFNAIHLENRRINTEADILNFVAANGVDRAKFTEAWKSFGVNTKINRGKQLSNAYKIDGVPAIGVQGRFYTAPSLAGSSERAVAVADFLIQRARQGT
ncbi:thiol:disulfide interchange protein DsbA/DsbL [Rubrivivax rivuli]|uniref:Thiol:disulfide interchange protein n=1 Tax=Rubrivivax rivuli TaxID=1862385 RepID=A0A437RQQ2_9BURK|nr:thiol:disulfide interchange protein DsbA/DsbL [Rubrivivax rivuli]RVU49098.1 thiol:disulfide interchange protein DsbA/DsbL [Rubrivivax rivuli]